MNLRRLEILECWTSAQGAQFGPAPHTAQEIRAASVDDAIQQARERVAALGLDIRSLSVDLNGNLRAVVWRDGRPQTFKDPSWVWKRPAASAPKE